MCIRDRDIIMRTPGFVGYFEKPLQDAMAAGTMVTSEVELFVDFCPCEIVAVTGSDGKTTTTTPVSYTHLNSKSFFTSINITTVTAYPNFVSILLKYSVILNIMK